jgi:hypothetical protein
MGRPRPAASALKAHGLALALSAAAAGAVVVGWPAPSRALLVALFILSIPWVMPAFTAVAVLSVPLYMALHRYGGAPELAQWLAGTLIAGAVIGLHVNAMLLAARWLAPRRRVGEDGLAGFLRRSASGGRPPTSA